MLSEKLTVISAHCDVTIGITAQLHLTSRAQKLIATYSLENWLCQNKTDVNIS